MSFPIKRFDLDPTGRARANRIINEEHILGPTRGEFHALAPYYGPFYNHEQTLTLNRNGVEMVYGTDYFCVVMCSDDTMKFNGEICEIFLLRNCEEGDRITMDLQYLGGLYQNYTKGIEDLWNAFLNDDRPIHWNNIIGRPNGFNPAYHLHMLDDVVGWQPVLIALERLTNAVILRNVPAFEALIEWVLNRVPEVVSIKEIHEMDPVDKYLTFSRLLYSMRLLNFNAITFRPRAIMYDMDEVIQLDISSTNYPRQKLLYWSIEHITTEDSSFIVSTGEILVQDNEALLELLMNEDYETELEAGSFRVRLHLDSPTGAILCESKIITVQFKQRWKWDYGEVAHSRSFIMPTSTKNMVYAKDTPEKRFQMPHSKFWKSLDLM